MTTSQESVAKYAEWFTGQWRRYSGGAFSFAWFWDSIASQVTVAVLCDAARILNIANPGKTRSALRAQFAAAWVR